MLGTLLFSPEGAAALSRLVIDRQTSGTAFCTTICLTALEQATGASHPTAENRA